MSSTMYGYTKPERGHPRYCKPCEMTWMGFDGDVCIDCGELAVDAHSLANPENEKMFSVE